MTRALLVGLWLAAIAVGAAAVVKNMGGGDTNPPRSAAAAVSSQESTSTSTPTTAASEATAPTPTVTIQTDNDVLDRLDGVAPPGAIQWDDFRVFAQSPGADVAVSEAIDGSGAIAFFSFPSSDAAQAFVDNPPTHLAGIGDYAALQPLPAVPGAPSGANVDELRGCVSPSGLVVGCAGGSPPVSGGVIAIVPLDDFVLVAASWDVAATASPATQSRALSEAADALSFWTRTPH